MKFNFLEINSLTEQVPKKVRTVLFVCGVVAVLVFSGLGWMFQAQTARAKVLSTFRYIVATLELHGEQENPAALAPVIKPPELPKLRGVASPPASLTAERILVKDHGTGAVLFGQKEYEAWPLASISKLMSVLVLLEHPIDFSSTTIVISDAVVDTHMYAGDRYTLEELWQATLVGSSNKAVLSLIDATGWQREAFIERMNQKAMELGMGNSFFVEPTGLDAGNSSTAADVALLLEEALKQGKIKQALLNKKLSLFSNERNKSHHLWSTNWLLLGWIPHQFVGVTPGKTGYIAVSGYNFATQIEVGSGKILDVIVLGAKTHEARFTEAKDIANWVLANYVWPGEEGYESPTPTTTSTGAAS